MREISVLHLLQPCWRNPLLAGPSGSIAHAQDHHRLALERLPGRRHIFIASWLADETSHGTHVAARPLSTKSTPSLVAQLGLGDGDS